MRERDRFPTIEKHYHPSLPRGAGDTRRRRRVRTTADRGRGRGHDRGHDLGRRGHDRGVGREAGHGLALRSQRRRRDDVPGSVGECKQ